MGRGGRGSRVSNETLNRTCKMTLQLIMRLLIPLLFFFPPHCPIKLSFLVNICAGLIIHQMQYFHASINGK